MFGDIFILSVMSFEIKSNKLIKMYPSVAVSNKMRVWTLKKEIYNPFVQFRVYSHV